MKGKVAEKKVLLRLESSPFSALRLSGHASQGATVP